MPCVPVTTRRTEGAREMKVTDGRCRLCGKSILECRGWLARVSPKGGPAVWECRPSCDGKKLSQEDAILGAIKGDEQEVGK